MSLLLECRAAPAGTREARRQHGSGLGKELSELAQAKDGFYWLLHCRCVRPYSGLLPRGLLHKQGIAGCSLYIKILTRQIIHSKGRMCVCVCVLMRA